jgi:hypothetical protein
VDAVLAATDALAPGEPFGVANADDLYGVEGLALLAGALPHEENTHALVAYRLRDTLVGDEPVTRGVCRVGPDGHLLSLDERRKVAPVGDGRYRAHDDREPAELDGETPVSVNLWGFGASSLRLFRQAMAEGDGSTEVLLPEVVSDLVSGRRSATTVVRVVRATGRCIGVTHPGDLALVRAELAGMIGRGERPAALWTRRCPAAG